MNWSQYYSSCILEREDSILTEWESLSKIIKGMEITKEEEDDGEKDEAEDEPKQPFQNVIRQRQSQNQISSENSNLSPSMNVSSILVISVIINLQNRVISRNICSKKMKT